MKRGIYTIQNKRTLVLELFIQTKLRGYNVILEPAKEPDKRSPIDPAAILEILEEEGY